MAVSKLDNDDDWLFGNHNADYLSNSEEIAQNVKTRIKFFVNDWFANIDAGIDWFTILSNKNNENTIINQVERVILETFGVLSVNNITVKQQDRSATVSISYTDIFNENIENSFKVEL